MEDQSHLDRKYFINRYVWNCPFCRRNHVKYSLQSRREFDWDNSRECRVYFTKCASCEKTSMHLSYKELNTASWYYFDDEIDIDDELFYSQPTSFFAVDSRIPRIIRELITEAEGCMKMGYLTGASACLRKAIYELLGHEKLDEGRYEDRIKKLKEKFAFVDPEYFDALAGIQKMTSDKVHEQSWQDWDSHNLMIINETFKSALYEMYVTPDDRRKRLQAVQDIRKQVVENKKPKAEETPEPG